MRDRAYRRRTTLPEMDQQLEQREGRRKKKKKDSKISNGKLSTIHTIVGEVSWAIDVAGLAQRRM